jgi:hypothetical protein
MEAVWRVFRIDGEPPITRQTLRMIGMPFTLNISRARKELGYQPVVTWESGIAAMGARVSNPPLGVTAGKPPSVGRSVFGRPPARSAVDMRENPSRQTFLNPKHR